MQEYLKIIEDSNIENINIILKKLKKNKKIVFRKNVIYFGDNNGKLLTFLNKWNKLFKNIHISEFNETLLFKLQK